MAIMASLESTIIVNTISRLGLSESEFQILKKLYIMSPGGSPVAFEELMKSTGYSKKYLWAILNELIEKCLVKKVGRVSYAPRIPLVTLQIIY